MQVKMQTTGAFEEAARRPSRPLTLPRLADYSVMTAQKIA